MDIKTRTSYCYAIFDISGNITYDNFKQLEDYIIKNAPENFENIILNIEKVPYINSSALGWLVKLMQKINNLGFNLFLMNVNSEIMGLLKLTNTFPYFKIIPDEKHLVETERSKELDKILEDVEDDLVEDDEY